MGRIRVLPDQVANQIAAGEVVDRPASVVKELLENALDAGANRIRVEVEAGGRKLIRVTDDGQGMNRDDALLAFERHATSKLRTADDLLSIATLGFRGEALPSIASVARVTLETATGEESAGTRLEIAGGKILHVDDAALPRGTTLAVADLFFNTPARRKFLRAESTELAHVTALVTHYALAHPEKHFELLSATHTIVSAPPVTRTAERIYQIFGKDTLAATAPRGRRDSAGTRRPARAAALEAGPSRACPRSRRAAAHRLLLQAGAAKAQSQFHLYLREQAAYSRPAAAARHHRGLSQRDSADQLSGGAALSGDAARRGGCERPSGQDRGALPPAEPGPRLCPRQPADGADQGASRRRLSGCAGLCAHRQPFADASGHIALAWRAGLRHCPADAVPFCPSRRRAFCADAASARARSRQVALYRQWVTCRRLVRRRAGPEGLGRGCSGALSAGQPAARRRLFARNRRWQPISNPAAATARVEAEQAAANLNHLGSLRPLGQLRESFILATGDDGLWIIDQHVAHERVLFEKILRDRQVEKVQRQRLLMPLLVELKASQMVIFARIAEELERNGFEVEPFGPQTLAVKASPVGLEGAALERMLAEVIEQSSADSDEPTQNQDLTALRTRIAASIACHSAIKVNTALDPARMEWLLLELARTSHPTSCPHGRPIALLYSWKEIQRAFHRI